MTTTQIVFAVAALILNLPGAAVALFAVRDRIRADRKDDTDG